MKRQPAAPGDVEKAEYDSGYENGQQPGSDITLEAEPRLGRQRPEDVLDGKNAGGQSRHSDEEHGDDRDPRVARFAHIDKKGGANRQGNRGEQLVAGAKQRPQSGDGARIDEVSPGQPNEEGGKKISGQPGGLGEGFGDFTKQFLKNIPRHARAGINRCQDERSFNPDTQLIPISHQTI